jgi:glycosyltransferase involved in cell wall biosynthesis
LRGACTDQFAEELQRIAREYGVDERLHILPIASPNRMEELAAAYDVGFCGETGHTLNRRVALTNKQFTYLLAGVPVIMSSIPSHLNFAAEAGRAVELFEAENSSSLAQALDRVLGDPVRLAAMRARAWELGQTRFNWDTDSKRLVEIVRRTVRASYGTPTATSIVGKML